MESLEINKTGNEITMTSEYVIVSYNFLLIGKSFMNIINNKGLRIDA